jgi:hypothetical protein
VQAGVGFWLADRCAVHKLALDLAKAQFAARRDPHDCALMYIALGKKSLLQVGTHIFFLEPVRGPSL